VELIREVQRRGTSHPELVANRDHLGPCADAPTVRHGPTRTSSESTANQHDAITAIELALSEAAELGGRSSRS